MTNGAKLCFMVSFTFYFLKFPALILAKPQVPCYFIFGDSLVDSGNNNELQTTAKANYPPYGIDFPNGPTGRFTNGRTIADFIADDLGFDLYIPPFATAKDEDIMGGVNYASGGAGIRDETGKQLGEVISLSRQLANHQHTISRISALNGNKDFAAKYLTKCLYTFTIGSNDYINNYLTPQFYNSSHLFTPIEYAKSLIQQYSQHLQSLHKLGAKKIGLFELGVIGCAPAVVEKFGTTETVCIDKVNYVVKIFNDKLKVAVEDLNHKFSDAKFVLIKGKSPTSRPSIPGLKISSSPCCYKINVETGQCKPNISPCSNRLQHLFFDGFHPSESANFLLSKRATKTISQLIHTYSYKYTRPS